MKLFCLLLIFVNLNFIISLVWNGNFANFGSWPIKNSYLAENREVVADPKGGNDKVLKVKYQAGSYSKGAQKGGTGFFVEPFANANVENAVLEYDVLFPNDFDFVKGGKLPGMFGGRHDCNGGDMALDCFSARFMFGPNGGGYGYIYVSKKANHTKEFCALTRAPNCAPDYGYGLGGSKYFEKNKWVHIKELIKLNTVGQQNGRLAIWVDGDNKFDFNKMVFRTTPVSINGLEFETFFGGSTADWATKKEEHTYFKNFKIETF